MAEELTNNQTEEEIGQPLESEAIDAAEALVDDAEEAAEEAEASAEETPDEEDDYYYDIDEDPVLDIRDHRILKIRAPMFYGLALGFALGYIMVGVFPVLEDVSIWVEIGLAAIGYFAGKRYCGFPLRKPMKECEAEEAERKYQERKAKIEAQKAAQAAEAPETEGQVSDDGAEEAEE